MPREVRRACFRGSGSVARSRLAPLQRRRRTAKVAAPAVPVLGRLRRPIRGRDRLAVLCYARCERGVYTAKAERKERTIRRNELEICRFHVSAQCAQAGPAPVTPNLSRPHSQSPKTRPIAVRRLSYFPVFCQPHRLPRPPPRERLRREEPLRSAGAGASSDFRPQAAAEGAGGAARPVDRPVAARAHPARPGRSGHD